MTSKSMKEVRQELSKLRSEKSNLVKEHKSFTHKSPITDKIHKDLIAIYDYQITTLNWVLGKRKNLL